VFILGKIISWMNEIIKYVLIVIMVTLILAVFFQVLFRFILNQPLAWTEELARYCLIWITFLGASYAMSLKAHIGLSIVVDRSPVFLKQFFIILAGLVSIGFFWIMIQQGFNLASRSMTQLSPVLRLPMGYIYLVIPISGIFLAINLLQSIWEDLTKKEVA
jgi:TRAP-type C4-dicarboxylate transport system permease small subunit